MSEKEIQKETRERRRRDEEVAISFALPAEMHRRLSNHKLMLGCTYKELLGTLVQLYLDDEEVQRKCLRVLGKEDVKRLVRMKMSGGGPH